MSFSRWTCSSRTARASTPRLRCSRSRCPHVRIVLSASDERDDVLDAVKAGATGYLVKSASKAELREAVQATAAERAVFTPSLAGLVLGEYRRIAHSTDDGLFAQPHRARDRSIALRRKRVSAKQTTVAEPPNRGKSRAGSTFRQDWQDGQAGRS